MSAFPMDRRNDFRLQARPGTPLDRSPGYSYVAPKRHKNLRAIGRALTTPGSMQRRWNMRDYKTQAKYGVNWSPGWAQGVAIPYSNR